MHIVFGRAVIIVIILILFLMSVRSSLQNGHFTRWLIACQAFLENGQVLPLDVHKSTYLGAKLISDLILGEELRASIFIDSLCSLYSFWP